MLAACRCGVALVNGSCSRCFAPPDRCGCLVTDETHNPYPGQPMMMPNEPEVALPTCERCGCVLGAPGICTECSEAVLAEESPQREWSFMPKHGGEWWCSKCEQADKPCPQCQSREREYRGGVAAERARIIGIIGPCNGNEAWCADIDDCGWCQHGQHMLAAIQEDTTND